MWQRKGLSRRVKWLQCGMIMFALAPFAQGCGMGTDPSGNSAAAATLTAGMPRCDPALLHPRITVGATAALPGQLMVYVDGVMACVDDAAKVDQILSQIDGHTTK